MQRQTYEAGTPTVERESFNYPPDAKDKDTKGGEIQDVSVLERNADDPAVGGAHMHRALKARHVSMIAIAGTIGTGLFLGSGRALANGGPVGASLGYLIVGLLVGAMMYCLGEMMVYDPSASGFIEFASRYVDPGFGFAMGWQFVFQTAMTAPTEVVAASIVVSYWDDNTSHLAIYIAVFLAGMIAINMAGVRYFGEFEFWFACVKLVTVIGLIIMCLVVDLGGAPDRDRRGFRYWKREPFNAEYRGIEPASLSRFLGFWAVLTQASFSYGGMEGLASICLEAENPRKTMKTAVKTIFYRIVGLYIISVTMIGLCISRRDPNLLQAVAQGTGNAAQSPFVVIIKTSQIRVLDHIINAVVLTSAFSSGNEFLYASSRSLFMLAQAGQAPRIFSKVLKNGVPVVALGTVSLFSLLAFLNVSSNSSLVFTWLSNITTLGSQITWIGIGLSHIRFYQGMKAQGVPRSVLPFTSAIQPYGAWAVVIGFTIIAFFNGWTSFSGGFNASNFFSSYVNVIFFFVLWGGWKFVKKTKIPSLQEMDVTTHYEEGSVVYSKMQ